MKVKHKVVEQKDYLISAFLFLLWNIVGAAFYYINLLVVGRWGAVLTVPILLYFGILFERNGFAKPITHKRIEHEI